MLRPVGFLMHQQCTVECLKGFLRLAGEVFGSTKQVDTMRGLKRVRARTGQR